MSKISFTDSLDQYPRVAKRIQLGDYHKDLKGDFIDAWQNIDRELSNSLLAVARESIAIAQLDLGPDRDERLAKLIEDMQKLHSRWWDLPLDTVKAIYRTDVALYNWLVTQSSDARTEYEKSRKKDEKE